MKERNNKPASDNSAMMYTMTQLALYCKRSLPLLKKMYRLKRLPDPAHTIKHTRKKTRLYTLAECKQIKNFFESQQTAPPKKRKYIRRKSRRYY